MTGSRKVGIILAAWVLSIAFDFFLHGGVLARLYLVESPFLLPAESAFARIPLGYLSFLILTLGLWWLLEAVGVRGWFAGFRLGLLSGLVLWGGLTLGLFSISTAPSQLLAAWWLGQAMELGLAGAVIGAGLDGVPTRRIYAKVAAVAVLCVVATIALQAAGLAPAMKITT